MAFRIFQALPHTVSYEDSQLRENSNMSPTLEIRRGGWEQVREPSKQHINPGHMFSLCYLSPSMSQQSPSTGSEAQGSLEVFQHKEGAEEPVFQQTLSAVCTCQEPGAQPLQQTEFQTASSDDCPCVLVLCLLGLGHLNQYQPLHAQSQGGWALSGGCLVTSVVSNSLWPHGLLPMRLLCLQDFPGKNTGVGCHFLLQRNLSGRNNSRLFPLAQDRNPVRMTNWHLTQLVFIECFLLLRSVWNVILGSLVREDEATGWLRIEI